MFIHSKWHGVHAGIATTSREHFGREYDNLATSQFVALSAFTDAGFPDWKRGGKKSCANSIFLVFDFLEQDSHFQFK